MLQESGYTEYKVPAHWKHVDEFYQREIRPGFHINAKVFLPENKENMVEFEFTEVSSFSHVNVELYTFNLNDLDAETLAEIEDRCVQIKNTISSL